MPETQLDESVHHMILHEGGKRCSKKLFESPEMKISGGTVTPLHLCLPNGERGSFPFNFVGKNYKFMRLSYISVNGIANKQ